MTRLPNFWIFSRIFLGKLLKTVPKLHFTMKLISLIISRPGCSASERYNFECPSFGLNQRFGDHDRLAHPTDCSLFYACLRNGAPRLLSCQAPTVFNPETGFCEHHSQVPGCVGFYPDPEPAVDREALAQQIREEILKEFNLSKQ